MAKPEGKDFGEVVIRGFEVFSSLLFLAENKILLSSCFINTAVNASMGGKPFCFPLIAGKQANRKLLHQ